MAGEHDEVEYDSVGDPILAVLVGMADREEASFSVSLTVAGVLVTGHVVGAGTYLRTLALQLRDAGGQPLDEVMEGLAEDYPSEPEFADDSDVEPVPALYLHLRDAVIWTGSQPFEAALWRCRLEAVDGFSFEMLGL